jgi:hypothetical protein
VHEKRHDKNSDKYKKRINEQQRKDELTFKG